MAMAAALVAVLACLTLAACGGSSSTTSKTAGGSAAARDRVSLANRVKAFRECLQKNGVALPAGRPGAGAGGLLGGTGAPPAGVSRARYEAALRKCGGANAAAEDSVTSCAKPAERASMAGPTTGCNPSPLARLDSVLEENAEDFVRGYIQKGGQ